MEIGRLLRVVALRKGKLKPVEFRLREGERGLSLFAYSDRSTTERIIDGVRAAGKQGELAAAILEAAELRSLGLVLVRTPSPNVLAEIKEFHWEARLPLTRKLSLFLRGVRPYDYFNQEFSAKLCALAQVVD